MSIQTPTFGAWLAGAVAIISIVMALVGLVSWPVVALVIALALARLL